MAGKRKDNEIASSPAWVMTFADLMSLLMCFFVLLLSFSELDRKKYKQVAGSMKEAFGVQREVLTQESPKGVTIIAQEFAPGKPQPTLELVLRQETTDDTQDYLEVLEAIDRVQEQSFGDERGLARGDSDTDEQTTGTGRQRYSSGDGAGGDGAGAREGRDGRGGRARDAGRDGGRGRDAERNGARDGDAGRNGARDGDAGRAFARSGASGAGGLDAGHEGRSAEEVAAEALELERALEQARIDAERQAAALREALGDELGQELLEVEAEDQGVLIKVREQGSFPSGQAALNPGFLPVLEKIARAILSPQSGLVVAGHTDDVPISTGRFPSNWELSAARASSVVQGFISQGIVARERLELRAFADTKPVVPNTSSKNRAKNRRVEIFISTLPLTDPRLRAARDARDLMATPDMGYEL